MVALDLCDQHEVDADPKANQEINFSFLKEQEKLFQIFHKEYFSQGVGNVLGI